MKRLDVTLSTPALNLACDEALLDYCEHDSGHEFLRFWEPAEPFAVLGYSNKFHDEINEESCQKENVPVLRRCSGGGCVLQSPGCLNYALILRIGGDRPTQTIGATNRFVMERHRSVFERLLKQPVGVAGHTDLTVGNLKFSGNAQRRKKNCLLFHGTLLLAMNLELVERYLKLPKIQPSYRKNRPHSDFITNVALGTDEVKEALAAEWEARSGPDSPSTSWVESLAHRALESFGNARKEL